jgi:F420-dependent oxidoreductase-like protein
MRVGIFVAETWDAASPLAEVRERARLAEALGFAHGWVPYLPWSHDALALVQAAGAATSHLELGSAVIPTYLFHPLALARQAATVEAALGRPLALGIGCSNQLVIEMHGLAYERPARHVREYLEVLHAARRSAGQVAYAGELFRVNGLYATPEPARGPILVGALGPRMLRVAGELSDGTLATSCDPLAIERAVRPVITVAAREAGRPEPRVGAVVPVALTHDVAAAREQARERFGIYDSLPRYRRMVELGRAKSAAEICVLGGERELRARLREYADAGLTDFLAAPFAAGTDRAASWRRTAECLAAVARES